VKRNDHTMLNNCIFSSSVEHMKLKSSISHSFKYTGSNENNDVVKCV
jgi:hypothetical protein